MMSENKPIFRHIALKIKEIYVKTILQGITKTIIHFSVNE